MALPTLIAGSTHRVNMSVSALVLVARVIRASFRKLMGQQSRHQEALPSEASLAPTWVQNLHSHAETSKSSQRLRGLRLAAR